MNLRAVMGVLPSQMRETVYSGAEPPNNENNVHGERKGIHEPARATAHIDCAYEPTVDMLVHDYDDETTIEEQEALSNESGSEELNALQEEAEMPIETILAMYYGSSQHQDTQSGGQHDDTSTSSCSSLSPGNRQRRRPRREVDILSNQDLTLDKEEIARDVLRDDDGSETSVDELVESVHSSSHTACLLGRVHSDAHSSDEDAEYSGEEDSEEDMEYIPEADDESLKKSIQVGPEFQAEIPECLTVKEENGSLEQASDIVMWEPSQLPQDEVVEYLRTANLVTSEGKPARSSNSCVADDEQALLILMRCCFDVQKASQELAACGPRSKDPLTAWSEAECQLFESGIREYGKNFHMIHKNKVCNRSTFELVNFYYYWKKTERRALFPVKIYSEDKRTYVLSPTADSVGFGLISGASESATSIKLTDAGNHRATVESNDHRLNPPICRSLPTPDDNDVENAPSGFSLPSSSVTIDVNGALSVGANDSNAPAEIHKCVLPARSPSSGDMVPLADNGLLLQ